MRTILGKGGPSSPQCFGRLQRMNAMPMWRIHSLSTCWLFGFSSEVFVDSPYVRPTDPWGKKGTKKERRMFVKHWVCQSSKGVGFLELSSPLNRNALSTGMLEELRTAVQSVESNPDIRVVVLQSCHPRFLLEQQNTQSKPVFCAGHDLKEIANLQKTHQTSQLTHLFKLCSDTMTSIALSTKPYIAKVDGIATAAGCQLVASCDLAYATNERSKFATPGVNLGLFCSTPAVALGRTVLRKHAMEMLLTGDFISAQKAQDIGLINRTLENPKALEEHVDFVAKKIASKDCSSIRQGKPGFVKQLSEPSLTDAYEVASQIMLENSLTKECQDGIDKFLNRR